MELARIVIGVQYEVNSREEFAKIASVLEARLREVGRDTFPPGVEIYFSLDDGSLITKIVAIGKIMGVIYVGLSQYSDVLAGAEKAYEHAKLFSSSVVEEVKNITGKHDRIIYKKASTPDLDTVRRIKRNVEALAHAPQRQRQKLVERIITDIARLQRKHPDDPELAALLREVSSENTPEIPQQMEEVLNIDERQRRKKRRQRSIGGLPEPQLRLPAVADAPSGALARRRPRFHYESVIQI